jgi:hypothetical protein
VIDDIDDNQYSPPVDKLAKKMEFRDSESQLRNYRHSLESTDKIA